MNRLLASFVALVIMSGAATTFGAIEQVVFDTPQLEQRYRSLIDELRCVVCQNQNLADSNAPLAKDLRTITANMLREGSSDKEIKQFMRARYGDFVLYDTPFNASTAFLWLGPLVLLIAVLSTLFVYIRRRQDDEMLKPTHANNEAERTKVRNLLRDAPQLDSHDNNKG